jgi:signal transduction histidine kinase
LKIKTKTLAGTIVSLVIAAVICTLLIVTTLNVRSLNNRRQLAINLTESIFDLNRSVLDFAVKPSQQTLGKLAPVTKDINKNLSRLVGRLKNPQQEAIIKRIRGDNATVDGLILRFNTRDRSSPQSVIPVTDTEMGVLHTILLQSDDMLSASDSIRDITVRELVSAEEMVSIFGVVLVAVIALILVGITLLVITSVTKPLLELESGTEIIAAGNFDHQIAAKRNDELGRLARSFNEMANQLKDSFAALETEIGERKKVERSLEEKNEELEGFAQTVSHDIKGPIASIGIAAQTLNVLLARPIGEESMSRIEEIAKTIDSNVEKTGQLIDDILSLAEAGRVAAGTTDVGIRQIVGTILTENLWITERRGIRFEIGDDLGTIRANPTQIYQIFSNLISNAINYNDSIEPVIEVSYLGKDEAGHRYLVRDNGSGIQDDELDKIFIPFFRSRKGGTGVGLATVARIIGVYGGSIKAYNRNGPCFEFVIRDLTDSPLPKGR